MGGITDEANTRIGVDLEVFEGGGRRLLTAAMEGYSDLRDVPHFLVALAEVLDGEGGGEGSGGWDPTEDGEFMRAFEVRLRR